MSTREEEIKETELSQIEKAKGNADKLRNKESKFLFFVARSGNPAASIYEIYRHATTVKNMGYDVRMVTDGADYVVPDWIESELTDLPHEAMDKIKLTVGTADVVVIPEIFSNVMESTKNLPCIRIGLLQSFDYMVNGLLPSTDWSTFGIENVITTSTELVTLMKEFYGENTFNIEVTPPTIPDYFKYDGELKRPVVSIVGRNPNEISKVVKLFYSKFPQYSWLMFDSMITESKPPTALRRKDYAERLKKNFAVVWVDRISSFGTLPLEAMATNTITVGLAPDILPEYLIGEDGKQVPNTGIWTDDIYAIPVLVGEVLTKFLDDSIDDTVFDQMRSIVDRYRPEVTTKKIESAYSKFIDSRLTILDEAIKNAEAAELEAQEK